MERLLHILLFIWSTGTNMIRKVFPAYLAGFIPSAFMISLVNTGYSAGKALSIPCGIASDRMGKVRSLMLSFLLIAIVAVLISLTVNILHYVILFVIIGLVSNFYYNANNALISMRKKKTKTFFHMEAFYQAGLFLGPLLGGFIVSFYSMTLALYTWAIFSIIGLSISTLLSRKNHIEEKSMEFRKFLGEIRRDETRSFSFFIVGALFTGFFFTTMNFAMPLYIVSLGMEIYHVGIVIGIGAVISTVGTYLLGSVFQKLSIEKSLVIMMLMTGLAFLSMAYFSSIIALSIIFGVFNIGRAGGLNISRVFISRKTTRGTRSTGMAFIDTFHFGGGFLGPLIAGLMIDTVSFQSVFFMIFGISLVGIMIILFEKLRGRNYAN